MAEPGRIEEREVQRTLSDGEVRRRGRELARALQRAAKLRAAEAARAKAARAEIRDVEGECARLSGEVASGVEVVRMNVRVTRSVDGEREELWHVTTGELLVTGPAPDQLHLADRRVEGGEHE